MAKTIISCGKCFTKYESSLRACPACNNETPSVLLDMEDEPGMTTVSNNQPKLIMGYTKSYWVSSGIAGIVMFIMALYFFGEGEPAAPKTAAEIRQESIEAQFSAFSGAHRELERTIKAAMIEPDSYEHVETVYFDDTYSLRVQTTYKGRNAFGGMAVSTVTARVGINGEILSIISQE